MKQITILISFFLFAFSVKAQKVVGTTIEARDSIMSLNNNTDLILRGKGTGKVSIEGNYTFPEADGTAGQFLETDGAGNLEFVDAPDQASGISVDPANFRVETGTNVQDVLESIDSALFKARGTEVVGGTGAVTFTPGTTVFDVAATEGQIKDATGYYAISFAGQTGISLISTSVISIYVYIDKNGAVQQQTTVPTRDEFRSKLFLTRLALSGGTLAAQEEIANPSGQYMNALRDFVSYQASPKKGLNISGNANLTFQVASGSIFELGISNSSDQDNPNEKSFTAQNPTTFFYVKRDATIATGQTSINVTQYDLNGTLTTMTNNRFKIMTVYKFNSGNHIVQEGQAEYATLDAAQAGISTRSFVANAAVANGTRIGWILVQKNATDLTNTATARFIQDEGTTATSVGVSGALLASNNLSDLTNTSTARTNLAIFNGATDNGVATYNSSTNQLDIESQVQVSGSSIFRGATGGFLTVDGGNATGLSGGAGLTLYGSTSASSAGDILYNIGNATDAQHRIRMTNSTSSVVFEDASSIISSLAYDGTWDYQNNDLTDINSLTATTINAGTVANSAGDIVLTANASGHVNISAGGLEVGGTEVISSGRAISGTSFTDGGSRTFVGGAVVPTIRQESTGASGISSYRNSNDVSGTRLILGKSRGTTIGSNTLINNGDQIATIEFYGSDGTSDPALGAFIRAQADNATGSNDMPSSLIFGTSSDGSDSPAPRLTINSSGNMVISGTVGETGTRVSNIYTTNQTTTNAETVDSDSTLKANINTLQEVDISGLRPVTYHWKNDSTEKLHYGVIAQEVQQVYPELVVTHGSDSTATLAVAYTEMIPILLAKIKELESRIEALEQ